MSDDGDPVRDLIGRIQRHFGLDLGGARFPVLQDALAERHANIGVAAAELMATPLEKMVPFVETLTNNETHFCRHRSQFESLRRELTSAWMQGRPVGDLKVWSAGCSSGEEPLTVAMLMSEIGGVVAGTGSTILATDVNERALAAARLGRYRKWSFRGVPEGLVEQYFEPVSEGVLRPIASLRNRITFEYQNLMEAPPGVGAFDMVFCRNVLIYFAPDSFRVALDNLGRAVKPGGLLILGPTEGAGAELPGFDIVSDREAVLFRKQHASGQLPSRVLFVDAAPSAAPPPEVPPLPPAPVATVVPPAPAAPPASPVRPEAEPAPVQPSAGLDDIRRLADAGEHGRALELLSAHTAAHGPSHAASLVRALLAVEVRDDATALEAVDAVLAEEPAVGFAHYVRGAILERRGDMGAAEQAYTQALAELEALPAEANVPLAGGLTVRELTNAIDVSLAHFRRKARHG